MKSNLKAELVIGHNRFQFLNNEKSSLNFEKARILKASKSHAGFTLVEVLVSAAVAALTIGLVMTSLVKMREIGKWQSAYETAYSYAQQAAEYSLYVAYTNLSLTNGTSTWVSNNLLCTTSTSTNFIPTTKNDLPYTLTNVTYLATQTTLPLDDLGSYVVGRYVMITDRTSVEPAATNLNYKLITVSNDWVFLGRHNPPIVLKIIRDAP